MPTKWIVLSLLGLAGCTAVNGENGTRAVSAVGTGQCFDGSAVNNFNVRDRKTLYISTRQGYAYRLDTQADCFALGTESATVAPFNQPTAMVCVGGQAAVSTAQSRSLPTRCIARVSGPLTDSRESGLPSRVN